MQRLFTFLILIHLGTTGCGPMERSAEETEQVKKEMNDREIKRVLPSEIVEKAREKGKAVTDEAQKALLQTLMKKIQSEGVVGAIEFCNINALPIMDSLSQVHKAEIRRVSNKWRNPNDAPTAEEEPIVEAYAYAAEQGQEMRDEVYAEDGAEQVIYTRPIMIGAALCLQCHGEKGKELTAEAAQKLQELYPEDKATGYQLGEWRGLWKVTFLKKDIVLEL